MFPHLSVVNQGGNQDTCSIDFSFVFRERERKNNTNRKQLSWKRVELGEKPDLEST